mgnify:CR=1 FL=1
MSEHRDCCPTCRRPYPINKAPARICRKCKMPIATGHKFVNVPLDKVGEYALEHRNCKTPDTYGKY